MRHIFLHFASSTGGLFDTSTESEDAFRYAIKSMNNHNMNHNDRNSVEIKAGEFDDDERMFIHEF
jgi:hypothetical protein